MTKERTYWIIGENPPFRLSKDNCQKFLAALVACGGRIHDSNNFSFDRLNGSLYTGITLGRADAVFSISIPLGKELIFDQWMNGKFREPSPVIHCN